MTMTTTTTSAYERASVVTLKQEAVAKRDCFLFFWDGRGSAVLGKWARRAPNHGIRLPAATRRGLVLKEHGFA